MSKKWIIIAAIVAGCAGGGLATANMIEALNQYSTLITAGAGFVGAIIAYFVAKANSKPVA